MTKEWLRFIGCTLDIKGSEIYDAFEYQIQIFAKLRGIWIWFILKIEKVKEQNLLSKIAF